MARPILTLEERFMSKVEPEPNSGCWLWTGAVQRAGYGIIAVRIGGRWKTQLAHRVAWLVLRGENHAERHVLHRCDNPPCVNPDHLYLGNDSDNSADRVRRGRCAKSASGLPFGVVRFNGHRLKKPFIARFTFGKVRRYLGYHETPEAAAAVVREFQSKCYGGEV